MLQLQYPYCRMQLRLQWECMGKFEKHVEPILNHYRQVDLNRSSMHRNETE